MAAAQFRFQNIDDKTRPLFNAVFCFVAVVAVVDVVVIAASADVVVVAAVADVVFVVFVVAAAVADVVFVVFVVAAAVVLDDDVVVVVAKVFILDKLYILYSNALLGPLRCMFKHLQWCHDIQHNTPSKTTLCVPDKVPLFIVIIMAAVQFRFQNIDDKTRPLFDVVFCFVAAAVDVVVIAASADVVVVAAVAAVVFDVFVVAAAVVLDNDIVVIVAKVFILDKLYILYSNALLDPLYCMF